MKKVLLACSENGRETVGELPFVLKRAELDVTLMCSRTTRKYVGSFYKHWIESTDHQEEIIGRIAGLVTQFDWILLGDDALLRALLDSELPEELKTRIGPMATADHLAILGSKIETARFVETCGILAPAFRICAHIDEIEPAAQAIGFPVMVKIDRSGGGEGVFKCGSAEDIEGLRGKVPAQKILVEKYIDGELINVEPLYIRSRLAAYAYSKPTIVYNGVGASMRRQFEACPSLRPTLETIGTKLGLTGFCNVSFIYEPASRQHYLIELDLRPNAWIAHCRFAGIDFSHVLKKHLADPTFDVKNFDAAARTKIVSLFYREIPHFIHTNDNPGLLYWLRNTNKCWQTLPFYDPRFFWRRGSKILALLATRLKHSLGARMRRRFGKETPVRPISV